MFKKKKTAEKPNRKRIKYIASVETTKNHWREDFSFGRDGHSLSSSGRWTDAKLFSTKKEAERVSKEIASGFDKKENPKPHVRAVYYDDDSRRLYYDDDCKRRYHGK